jgi:phage gp29-like protein
MTAERVRTHIASRFNPIRALTPEVLSRHLEEFDAGYLRNAALAWQKIRDRDDQVRTCASLREMALSQLDWQILPVDDSPEAGRHKEALEWAYNNLTATHALERNVAGGVELLVRQMADAVGKRYAVHEILWDPRGPGELTAQLVFTPLWFFENQTGRLRFLRQDLAIAGEELEEAGWLVTTGDGLMEATSVAYLFKQLPLKDWLIYCEKFGMPGLHGKTNAQKGTPEWEAMRDALANFGVDWSIITSLAAEISPIQAGAQGTQPHPELVDRMDRAISRLWRGGDLATMSREGDGVGSNPQGDSGRLLLAADAQLISGALQQQFDRWVIAYRFGRDVEPLAYFELQLPAQIDIDREIKIDEALIKWGCPRGKKDLLERYGRPEPDKGDELATAPVAPAPQAMGDGRDARGFGNSSIAETARGALFQQRAVALIGAAERAALRPLLERIAALDTVSEAELPAAIAQLEADLPALQKAALKDERLVAAWETVLGAPLASGLAEDKAP